MPPEEVGVTTARRTDYSREESLRRLGPDVIAEIDRVVAAAPVPSAATVRALQILFDQIDADIAREDAAATRVARAA